MRPPRAVQALAGAAALSVALTACGGTGGHHSPVSSGHTGSTTTSTSTAASKVTVSAALLADAGLPSQLGPAPIAQPKLTALVQYLEDHVALAYAHGNADELYHYLAGTMLTGNRATINVLNGQKRRNDFKVRVNTVTIQNSDPDQVVVDMDGDLTQNYFVDAASGAVLAGGLPGPSHIDFQLFLNYYPANHTWYWTGEQDQSSAGDGSDVGGESGAG